MTRWWGRAPRPHRVVLLTAHAFTYVSLTALLVLRLYKDATNDIGPDGNGTRLIRTRRRPRYRDLVSETSTPPKAWSPESDYGLREKLSTTNQEQACPPPESFGSMAMNVTTKIGLLDPAAYGLTCKAIATKAELGQPRQPPKLPRYQSCTTGDDVV